MGVAALGFDAGAPARDKVRANCAPKPLDAPVTNATRPDRSML
jgi:hypothetical protein